MSLYAPPIAAIGVVLLSLVYLWWLERTKPVFVPPEFDASERAMRDRADEFRKMADALNAQAMDSYIRRRGL